MSKKPAPCIAIEEDLLATAIGEASEDARRRVERHVGVCGPCRREFHGYQDLDRSVTVLKEEMYPGEQLIGARDRLETRLADLRSRLVAYRIFPSPLGNILIAQSELGISTVEYLERRKTVQASRLIHRHEPGIELVEGGEELEPVCRDLMQYLDGCSKRLEWPWICVWQGATSSDPFWRPRRPSLTGPWFPTLAWPGKSARRRPPGPLLRRSAGTRFRS
jgi:hypothetical protein